MPRAAEEGDLEPALPWSDWRKDLNESPFGALFFGPEDFGNMTPRRFKDLAKKAFGPTVSIGIRGEEVLVRLNA